MTYNQLEIFFMTILHSLMQDEQLLTGTLDENINEVFGHEDATYMDIRDPETLLSILRIKHGDFYKQLFCSTILVIKTILQQFTEDMRLPIAPIIISQPFIRTFQHLYPEKFNAEEFRIGLQEIPYYTERLAVRQNTNAFILVAARIFCTIEHYHRLEVVIGACIDN
jgi:hypothetical protein